MLINSQNPLALLHSALSEGLHTFEEKECLEIAGSIRTVLIEFADRLGQALKEEAELNAAVNRLTGKKKKPEPGAYRQRDGEFQHVLFRVPFSQYGRFDHTIKPRGRLLVFQVFLGNAFHFHFAPFGRFGSSSHADKDGA